MFVQRSHKFASYSIPAMMSLKICTYLLLLLGLTLPVLSYQCPDHDSLPEGCDCEDELVEEDADVELSCSGSTIEDLQKALSLMDKSSRLEVQLDDINLGFLPSKIFDGLNVVKLDISHCQLEGLAPPGEYPLQGLEDKLEVLVVTSSFSEEEKPTPLYSLAHLNRLHEVDFSYNAITEVHNLWFSSPPPKLSHLSLSNNGIEKLGDRAFATLSNLEHFELHGNRFGPIKRSMLPTDASKLEHIELDNNALTSVSDDLFTNMPSLSVLSLRTNGIANLQKNAFKPIWSQLDLLDVRGNPIQCDSSLEWSFREHTEAVVFGTCEGPEGREGKDLQKFIEKRGH